MQLRDYQSEAVEAVFAYLARGGRAPLVEVPTGGGKSAILGEIVRRVVGVHGGRVVVATHRKELIAQDEAAILRVWPDGRGRVGVYSAGLARREYASPALVCGVQSVHSKAKKIGHTDVVIIDEAHLVSASEGTQYQRLLRGLYESNPDLCVVGLTATPYRLGQGYLTQGEDALFTSIVYRVDVKRLIDEGYLSRLVTGKATASIDTSQARTSAGDWVVADLELAADIDEVTDAVADDIAKSGRRHILVFGVSVGHAARLRNAIRIRGLSCEMVVGETPDRDGILGRFKRGELACITSCDVLTTGFDAPLVDCVALVRPTQSPGLYVQMVGRGSRIADGKADCLILDFGGNIARHGPLDAVRVKPKGSGQGGGKAPVKTCVECYAEIPASSRTCAECDAEQPAPERKANRAASQLAVVSEPGKQIVLEVNDVQYAPHVSKASGSTTLRVSYYGPASKSPYTPLVSEYVCLEHEGFARQKAEAWWRQHAPGTPIPATVADAMGRRDELRPVSEVTVKEDGDYLRVVAKRFAPVREPGSDDDKVPMGSNMIPRDGEDTGGFFDDDQDLPF